MERFALEEFVTVNVIPPEREEGLDFYESKCIATVTAQRKYEVEFVLTGMKEILNRQLKCEVIDDQTNGSHPAFEGVYRREESRIIKQYAGKAVSWTTPDKKNDINALITGAEVKLHEEEEREIRYEYGYPRKGQISKPAEFEVILRGELKEVISRS